MTRPILPLTLMAIVLLSCQSHRRPSTSSLPAVHQESYGSPHAYQYKVEADLFFLRGDFAAAAQAIVTAIDADPKDATLRATYGKILLGQEAYSEAHGQLNKALLFDPSHVGARLLLAEWYLAQDDKTNAMEQANNAHKYDRTGSRVLVWLAENLAATDPQLAARYFKDAIAMNPYQLPLYEKLGHLLCANDNAPAAQRYFRIYDQRRGATTPTKCGER